MKKDEYVYTSISICKKRRAKLRQCAKALGIEKPILLSALCYKAGLHVAKSVKHFQTVEYQERGDQYVPMPVHFFSADHEFMHANRLAAKVSVSLLLAIAIDHFLDEIMENGINPIEIAHLRVIENSYKEKSYYLRNFTLNITRNDQFEEFIMKMRYEKT